MTKIDIRRAIEADTDAIFGVHLRAAEAPIGLARRPDEISRGYVAGFVGNSLERGLIMVAEEDGCIVGAIHAYRPQPRLFAHVLSDLTIAVDPQIQGRGLGRKLFTAFLAEVRAAMPQICRVELFCRPDNPRGYPFYESLGFVIEGRLKSRVRTADGALIDDLFMGLSW